MEFLLISLIIALPMTIKSIIRYEDFFIKCYGDSYHEWSDRSDLVCPDISNNLSTADFVFCDRYFDKVCACNSRTKWQHNHQATVYKLFVEYLSVNGLSVVYSGNNNNSLYLSLKETNGQLRELPSNLCDYPGILQMDVSCNKISQLQPLTCLQMLDSFNASHNRCEFISNRTFVGLEKLRTVDLSHNKITIVEPKTFSQGQLHIIWIDMSFNNLRRIDYSNVFLVRTFCYVSYEHNKISAILNELDYVPYTEKDYNNSGGIVEFSFNLMTMFPDPDEFGFQNWVDYGFLAFNKFWFYLKNNRFYCDCNMHGIAKSIIPLLRTYIVKLDGNGVRCYRPERLSYLNVDTNFEEKILTDFICKYTSCPSGCSCYYQPHMNRTVIDCSKAGMEDVKDIDIENLTEWKIQYKLNEQSFLQTNIHALFKENAFRTIPNKTFLSRTSFLDISANDVQLLSTSTLRQMPRSAIINISNNIKLKTIPKSIRRFERKNVNMSGLVLLCACDDPNEMHMWLPDWLTKTDHSISSNPFCSVDGRLVDAKYVTHYYLGCNNITTIYIALSCVLAFFVGILGILWFFRREISILYRRCLQKDFSLCNYDFDLYIAFDDSDEQLLGWTVRTFCPHLESRGYKIFLPPRDMSVGDTKEEIIRENICRSRCCIFFLNKAFVERFDQWMMIEWSTAWRYYMEDRHRNVICINYDQLRRRDVHISVLKAFMICGHYIDFCRNNKFLASCTEIIGPPMERTKAMRNIKPKFSGMRKKCSVVKVVDGIELTTLNLE